MKKVLLLFAVVLTIGLCTYVGTRPRASSNPHPDACEAKSSSKIEFDTQVKPILQSRCQPCHFSGGVMHDRLPFDRAETIKKLGTKLFTRLKDENEQRLIREFLEQK
jgi:hypothetical protein